MKKLIFFLVIIIAIGITYNYYINNPIDKRIVELPFVQNVESMVIQSIAFQDKAEIPSKYTCDGPNVSPPLSFSGVPLNTKSLALIVEDLDSANKNFTHWIIFNLKPTINGIEENFLPENAKEGTNDFGDTAYSGPCPPSGTHRYQFRLYALDFIPDFENGITKKEFLNKIKGKILEQSEHVGIYSKN